jgi:dual specificity tyrosine-phosphorylation-regulated kinase 2/3/4
MTSVSSNYIHPVSMDHIHQSSNNITSALTRNASNSTANHALQSSQSQSSLGSFTPVKPSYKVPLTPAAALAISSLLNMLTPYEQSEILEFPNIYFVGSTREKIHGLPHSERNNGYDDERGDYRLVIGDHLEYRYEILSTFGKGSFGQVIKCYDYKKNMPVALKIIRNHKRFHQQALVEIKILEQLMSTEQVHAAHIVRVYGYFYFRNHLCITFEPLSYNLYEFLKSNNFRGISLGLVRRFIEVPSPTTYNTLRFET